MRPHPIPGANYEQHDVPRHCETHGIDYHMDSECPRCEPEPEQVQCIICEEWGPEDELAVNNEEPAHDECRGVLLGRMID